MLISKACFKEDQRSILHITLAMFSRGKSHKCTSIEDFTHVLETFISNRFIPIACNTKNCHLYSF